MHASNKVGTKASWKPDTALSFFERVGGPQQGWIGKAATEPGTNHR